MPPTAVRTYGDYVREVREGAGMTQAAISRRLGIARSTWARWEIGFSCPIPVFASVIDHLAQDFGVPPPDAPCAVEPIVTSD